MFLPLLKFFLISFFVFLNEGSYVIYSDPSHISSLILPFSPSIQFHVFYSISLENKQARKINQWNNTRNTHTQNKNTKSETTLYKQNTCRIKKYPDKTMWDKKIKTLLSLFCAHWAWGPPLIMVYTPSETLLFTPALCLIFFFQSVPYLFITIPFPFLGRYSPPY